MKLKLLSLAVVVLVAHAHFAQGALTFGTLTGALSGAVSTAQKVINTTTTNVGAVIDTVGTTIVTITTTTNKITETVKNATESVVADATTLLNNTITDLASTVATLLNNKLDAINDVIVDLSEGGLGNIPNDILSPVIDAIANLPNITQAVLQKIENLLTEFPEALKTLLAILENITTIDLPEIGILKDIQNIFTSTGSNITSPIEHVLKNEDEDLSNFIVPLTNATTAALVDVVSATANATEIIANVRDILETAVNNIPAAVETAFKPLTNLLTGSTTTCSSKIINQTLQVIADAKKNLASCISTEYETYKNLFTQFEDISRKLKDDIANGSIRASNVLDLFELAASISATHSIARFKIMICGSAQAALLIRNIVALVSSAISSTVSCIN